MRMLHAWRSRKSAEINGYAIYRDRHGRKVWVSVVADGPKKHKTLWPDMEYIGLVQNYRKKGSFCGRVPPTTEKGRFLDEMFRLTDVDPEWNDPEFRYEWGIPVAPVHVDCT